MDVELRHLRYFLAVAEWGSFSRAAEVLKVTQPTLSEQIRLLERETGPLFKRHPRGAYLTPAGTAMMPLAEDALRATRAAVQTARDIGASRLSQLRVGVVPGSCSHLISAFAAAYRAAFSECALTIREATYFQAPEDLLQDRFDVILTRLPIEDEHFLSYDLEREPLELFIGPNHPLAESTQLPVEDVLDFPIVHGTPDAKPQMMDYWLLTRYRNGELPRIAGNSAVSVAEFGYQIMAGNGAAVGTPSTRRSVGISRSEMPSVLLLCVEPSMAVAVHRRNDRRPEVGAFCLGAVQVCKALATLSEGLHGESGA